MNTHKELMMASKPVQADILTMCSIHLQILKHSDNMTVDELRTVIHSVSDAKKALIWAYLLRLEEKAMDIKSTAEDKQKHEPDIRHMTREKKEYKRRLVNRYNAVAAKISQELDVAISKGLALCTACGSVAHDRDDLPGWNPVCHAEHG